MATRHQIIEEFKDRYFKGNKKKESEILNHLEADYSFKRKSIVKGLNFNFDILI